MNKILKILKTILLGILFVFNVTYIKIFGFSDMIYVIYLLIFVVFGIYLINDLINHNKINNDNIYNLICIFVQLIIIFIIGRAIFDHNFLYNSTYHRNILEQYNQSFPNRIVDIKIVNQSYIIQNSLYFIIMLTLVLIYRKLNAQKKNSKYSFISLVCLFISVLTIIPTLEYMHGGDIKSYLIFNIILVSIEIYRLIKDNYKKREWIIFLSFVFNLLAFITIFINIFYK